jgi:hypothetical protein
VKTAILDAAALLFDTVDELRAPLTYTQPGVTSYTPGTGTATTGDVIHATGADGNPLRGLFFSFDERDGVSGFGAGGVLANVLPTDRKLELDPNDVTWEPRADNDYVTTTDPLDATATIREEVVHVIKGPENVSVVLWLRRAG